jgi:hypothetical protein
MSGSSLSSLIELWEAGEWVAGGEPDEARFDGDDLEVKLLVVAGEPHECDVRAALAEGVALAAPLEALGLSAHVRVALGEALAGDRSEFAGTRGFEADS